MANYSTVMLDAALDYAAMGWRVHPLHHILSTGECSCKRNDSRAHKAGKHPRLTKWQKKATTDPNLILKWWKQYPDANIGIVCGHASKIIVIDVDPGNGGERSLQEAIDAYDGLSEALDTYKVKTGGGRSILNPGT